MRLSTRLAAAAFTVAAFTAPATVGTAQAVQVPVATASVTDGSAGFTSPTAVTMKSGTLLTVVNQSGASQTYRVEKIADGSVVAGPTTIPNLASSDFAVAQVEDVNLSRTPNYRVIASNGHALDIIAL